MRPRSRRPRSRSRSRARPASRSGRSSVRRLRSGPAPGRAKVVDPGQHQDRRHYGDDRERQDPDAHGPRRRIAHQQRDRHRRSGWRVAADRSADAAHRIARHAGPRLVYPSPAGVPIAFGGSVTRIPQVRGGTRFDGVGVEVPIVASRRSIPGVSGSGLTSSSRRPRLLLQQLFQRRRRLQRVRRQRQRQRSGRHVLGFHLYLPKSGKRLDRHRPHRDRATRDAQHAGAVLGFRDRHRRSARPLGRSWSSPAAAFWTYGVGVRYRNMNISHGIVQQSETFPDLNVAINLDLRSHFIGPNLAVGFEVDAAAAFRAVRGRFRLRGAGRSDH